MSPRRVRYEPRAFYYLHILKTAGTSLWRLLSRGYSLRDTVELTSEHALRRFRVADLRGYRAYRCHMGYSMYELLGRPELPCLTTLRDPVERSISHLYFHQGQLERRPHAWSAAHLEEMQPFSKADLRICLESEWMRDFIDNYQCRFLGAELGLLPYLRDGAIGSGPERPLGPLPSLSPAHGSDDVAALADRALQRLEGMARVGIAERLGESAELFSRFLGLPKPASLPRRNVNPVKLLTGSDSYRDHVASDLVERIEELTTYDRVLYERAQELFEEQLSRSRADPKRSYHLAPAVRVPVHRAAQHVWDRAKRRWPKATRWLALHVTRRRID